MDENNSSFRHGERAAKLSVIVLLALSVSKGIVALFSGSVALLADSVHSFADIFSSVAVWVGMKLIQKKPSERFPYGYYRAETFALLIVSVTIIASGGLILKEAIDKLSEPGEILFPILVLIVAALSGLSSHYLGRNKRRVGSAIGSQSLVSEGQHSGVDVYASLLVFIGVFFSSLGFPIAEVLAGLAIGAYVIKVGIGFGKDAIFALMDVSLSPDRVTEIKRLAEGVQGIVGVHELRFRKSGPVAFGEMHIDVQKDLPLEKAHQISSEVEERIRKQFKDIESITIHMGVSHKKKIKIGIPILEDKGLESDASLHFGSAPFFAFIEVEGGQIKNVYVKVNEEAKLARKKGITVAHFLTNEKVDVVIAGSLGEGPFHVLRDSLIEIYHLPESVQIGEVIHLINQNMLDKMTSPVEMHERENDALE
ncbi:MAG: Cation transporter [Thermoproteota archaeon]|nr:Cation transporter [Thermoproteota archaeon]